MKKVRIDITGQKYGRLTVLSYAYTKNKVAFWKCKCDCGNEKIVRGSHLKNGSIKSCGCFRKEVTGKKATVHGKYGSRLYRIWKGIKGRCFNPSNSKYPIYGGRGITVCNEWLEYEPFYEWAMKNGYKEDLTIERIDVNGNYEPSNCTWVTEKEQSYNKRSNVNVEIEGVTKTLAEWAEYAGIKKTTIYMRYRRGYRGKDLIKPIEQTRAI